MSENEAINWSAELRALLHGQRDAQIRFIGSAEEYIARMVADAPVASTAEELFIDALDGEVTAWQPDRKTSPYFKRTLIELINAYTPSHGFGKLIEEIEYWLPDVPNHSENDLEIHHLTISAMARYFPAPPPDPENNAGFKQYLSVLLRLIALPEFTSLVTALLLRAGVTPISNPAVAEAVLNSGEILTGVLAYLQPRLRAQATDEVGTILRLCVERGEAAVERFMAALESLGLLVYLEADGVLILTHGGLEVRIPIDSIYLSHYTVLRWAIDNRRGLVRLGEFDISER